MLKNIGIPVLAQKHLLCLRPFDFDSENTITYTLNLKDLHNRQKLLLL